MLPRLVESEVGVPRPHRLDVRRVVLRLPPEIVHVLDLRVQREHPLPTRHRRTDSLSINVLMVVALVEELSRLVDRSLVEIVDADEGMGRVTAGADERVTEVVGTDVRLRVTLAHADRLVYRALTEAEIVGSGEHPVGALVAS